MSKDCNFAPTLSNPIYQFLLSLVLCLSLPTAVCFAADAQSQPILKTGDPYMDNGLVEAKRDSEIIQAKCAEYRRLVDAGKWTEANALKAEIDVLTDKSMAKMKEMNAYTDKKSKAIIKDLDAMHATDVTQSKVELITKRSKLATLRKANPNSMDVANTLHSIALNLAVTGDTAGALASYRDALKVFKVAAKTKDDKRSYYQCMHNYYDTLRNEPGNEATAKDLIQPLNELYKVSK